MHSMAVALGRVSLAPHLGNTVELVLMAKSQECESMSSEARPTPQKLQHLGEGALNLEWAALLSWLWRCGWDESAYGHESRKTCP